MKKYRATKTDLLKNVVSLNNEFFIAMGNIAR